MINNYFKYPIIWDLIMGLALFITCHTLLSNNIYLFKVSYSKLVEITSILISSSLTLIGFLLTILTIIITIKSVSNESPKSNTDGLRIFLNSNHYGRLILTITHSVWELMVVFGILFIVNILDSKVSFVLYSSILSSALLILMLPIIRTVYLLHLMVRIIANNNS